MCRWYWLLLKQHMCINCMVARHYSEINNILTTSHAYMHDDEWTVKPNLTMQKEIVAKWIYSKLKIINH